MATMKSYTFGIIAIIGIKLFILRYWFILSIKTKTARIINQFVERAKEILKNEHPANMVLLRGFAKLPVVPKFQEIYKLNPACVAVNGMYKGVSRLAGMKILEVEGSTLADEFTTLEKHWEEHDFFLFLPVLIILFVLTFFLFFS